MTAQSILTRWIQKIVSINRVLYQTKIYGIGLQTKQWLARKPFPTNGWDGSLCFSLANPSIKSLLEIN